MKLLGIYWKHSKTAGFLDVLKAGLGNLDSRFQRDSNSTITHWEQQYVDIFVGNSSQPIDCGAIFSTQNRLLAGKVFSKHDYQPIRQEQVEKSAAQTIKSFKDNFWGSYLYCCYLQDSRTLVILRDPTGQFPLYYTTYQDNIIFSSDIELLLKLLPKKPDFNQTYLANYLKHGWIVNEKTPFESIYECPHGCQLTLTATEENVTVVWNPLDYYNRKYNFLDFKTQFIETLGNTIKAWTSTLDGVHLRLSGGLDSSSILFATRSVLDTNKPLTAVSLFHSAVKSSTELEHARKVAIANKVHLTEFDMKTSLPFMKLKASKLRINVPASIHAFAEQEYDLYQLKQYTNSQYISGHGGDHVFMCPPATEAVCDYVIEHGLTGSYEILKELSSYYRRPILPLLGTNINAYINYRLGRKPTSSLEKEQEQYTKVPWFGDQINQLSKSKLKHPFLQQQFACLPGKFAQINELYGSLATINYDSINYFDWRFYPLLMQPVIELVLSIPSYKLFAAGYDRYPFRKSISEHYQTDLVWRKDKGDTTGMNQLAFKQNKQEILDICLNGYFAKQQLINKAILEEQINQYVAGVSVDHAWPISQLICAEIYMRQFK